MKWRLLPVFACVLHGFESEPRLVRHLEYARAPERALLLDLYLPGSLPGPYPVVLYIHGGGWSSGSKENPPVDRLVRRGYAVASIDYRLSQQAVFPAQIHDCKAAVRWLRANASRYDLDTARIVAWGGSAGGHLAALLGTSAGVRDLEGNLGNEDQSSRVQGVINFFGPTDLFQLNAARRRPRPVTENSPEMRLVGGRLEERRDVAIAANPISHLSKDDPPMLILHGDQDDVVPPGQSALLYEAMRQAGIPVEYRVIAGRGHGFRSGRDIDLYVDRFLETHLAPPVIERFGRYEATFNSAVDNAEFRSPSGRSYRIGAFFDGGGVWRVRFSPDEIGEWRYQSAAGSGRFKVAPYSGTNPLYSRGPLQSRETYLVHADGTPFFWLGDTVWNGPLLAGERDWRTFLADRAKKGFTAIQFVTTQWSAAFGDATGRTGYQVVDGKLRIDPVFFERLDRYIDDINAAGMVAVPVLLWAHNSRRDLNPGAGLPDDLAIELARYMAARWGAHQVVWLLNGDGSYLNEPERWKRIGHAVFAGAHPGRLSTMHPARRTWLSPEFSSEPWFHFIGYQSGHRDDDEHLRWLAQGPPAQRLASSRLLPAINLEPNYEAHRSRVAGATHYFDAYDVRRAAYWSLLVGPPAGFTYGAHGIWSWETSRAEPLHHAGAGPAPPWSEAMRLPGSLHMQHLKTLFASLEWWKLRPAHETLAEQPGQADVRRFIAVARSEDALVAYLPAGGTAALRIPSSRRARWFDPRTGTFSNAADVNGRFTAPDLLDWVLVVEFRTR